MSCRLAALVPLLLLCAAPAIARPADPAAITGRTIDGAPFALAALRGKVVLVNFWATWCAPCRAELPAIDAYVRTHARDGFQVIAISLDAGARASKLRAVTAPFAFTVAALEDVKMARGAIPTALPATLVFDRAGTLRFDSAAAKAPPLDAAALERIVTPLLAEQGAATR